MVAVSVAALMGSPAYAWQKDGKQPANSTSSSARDDKSAPAVEAVTVKAAATQISIDRRSYTIGRDVQGAGGSVADVLRNVPSVDVDMEGNVALRGDGNVTLLIDGKPSSLLSGQARGDALQQLPAERFERVEVMTNPSAEFTADGTAGVINLISRRPRGLGAQGTFKAGVGDRGAHGAGVSVAINANRLSLSADAIYRATTAKQSIEDIRVRLVQAAPTRVQDTLSRSKGEFWTARLAGDYDLDKNNRLSGDVSYQRYPMAVDSSYIYRDLATPAEVVGLLLRRGRSQSRWSDLSASANWLRTLPGDGHSLSVETSYNRTPTRAVSTYEFDQLTPYAAPAFDALLNDTTTTQLNIKANYRRRIGDAPFRAGYALQHTTDDFDDTGFLGPAGQQVPDPRRTSSFVHRRDVHAAYATYQMRLGALTTLAGLRLEATDVELNQRRLGVRLKDHYAQLFPTLHLQYALPDGRKITGSYSHRITRPPAYDLDPWMTFADAFNYRQGNPYLRPQQVDAWEMGYEAGAGGDYRTLTAFWRQTRDGFADITLETAPGVLLTTRENVARSQSGGVEFVWNTKVSPRLSANLTTRLSYNALDAAALPGGGDRHGYSLGGQLGLDWKPTPHDLLQLKASAIGRRLTAQGVADPTVGLSGGYRHDLTNRTSLTLVVRNIVATRPSVTRLESAMLDQRIRRDNARRGVYLTLNYAFGAKPPKPKQDFDYSDGSP